MKALSTAVIALVVASNLDAAELTPFRAVYVSEFNLGLSFSGELVRQLQRDNGQWQLSQVVDVTGASLSESSRFTQDSRGIVPLSYNFKRKVAFSKKKQSLSFDWGNNSATTRKGGQVALVAGTQDKLSYQLALSQDLKAGKRSQLCYPVLKKSSVEQLCFKLLGEEQVDTAMGSYTALKLKLERGENAKRSTHIWYAPSLDYRIVKLHQVEPDGKAYAISLKSYQPL